VIRVTIMSHSMSECLARCCCRDNNETATHSRVH
jgi:hypothetical protein